MADFEKRDTRRGTEPPGSDEGPENGGSDGDESGSREHGDGGGHAHGHTHDNDGHDHGDPAIGELGMAVVTISSTRTAEDDASGDAIVAACEATGASVETRDLLPDDHDRIQETVGSLVERPAIDAVITTGGTGVTPDDVTVEAVRPLLDKELPGFGELFRRYSEDEVGTRVVATRAAAGIVDGVPVFCLPGSENAAELGIGEIVIPEVAHLVGLARRGRDDDPE